MCVIKQALHDGDGAGQHPTDIQIVLDGHPDEHGHTGCAPFGHSAAACVNKKDAVISKVVQHLVQTYAVALDSIRLIGKMFRLDILMNRVQRVVRLRDKVEFE